MKIVKKSVTAKEATAGDGFTGFLARGIASGLYVGYLPAAQGTAGSLWGPALCLLLPKNCFPALWFTLPPLFLVGVWSAGRAEKYWGHDPGRVVIDEVVGMMAALAWAPINLYTVGAGFFLFRVFDILKPPPVRWSERLPGGWGVMADDLIAGVYANILVRLFIYFFPGIL
ncbi:MAG: phosphatidylglycerophosphatase A [Candidatus Latescibacter sp.]|nr:phosphatidylglycerophosphatase A [Candidatus Latescibacter sp.]